MFPVMGLDAFLEGFIGIGFQLIYRCFLSGVKTYLFLVRCRMVLNLVNQANADRQEDFQQSISCQSKLVEQYMKKKTVSPIFRSLSSQIVLEKVQYLLVKFEIESCSPWNELFDQFFHISTFKSLILLESFTAGKANGRVCLCNGFRS